MTGFVDRLSTPSVRAARAANGAPEMWPGGRQDGGAAARFGDREAAFIAARDSFYLATLSASGWPYVQHRGGPTGFLQVLDDTTLGFADFRGNRQYISLGNVAAEDKVALFLMDYPNRRRLKILARMTVHEASDRNDVVSKLTVPGYRASVERAFTLRLEAFDWNCSQHIAPRFTAAEIEAATANLRTRLASLEEENARLRGDTATRGTR